MNFSVLACSRAEIKEFYAANVKISVKIYTINQACQYS